MELPFRVQQRWLFSEWRWCVIDRDNEIIIRAREQSTAQEYADKLNLKTLGQSLPTDFDMQAARAL